MCHDMGVLVVVLVAKVLEKILEPNEAGEASEVGRGLVVETGGSELWRFVLDV